MTTDELIELLLDPKTYPHPVDVITTLETHISIVFLTGQFAYKLKKPVDFGFLDFSTLEKRKKFCQLEVQLNRRTAPDLYLGVYQLNFQASNTKQNSSVEIQPFDNNSNADEYIVKMRQFDPNSVLGRMLKEDSVELSDDIIEKLAQQIAQFHSRAENVALESELGEPKTQLQPMLDNFPSLEKTFLDESTQVKLATMHDWTLKKFDVLKPLLIERKKSGFIKACHGDLHLDNIALIDDEPLLFDGIEFNEHFRWIDVISDLAFLLSDLDFRNHRAASLQLLSSYLSKTLDYNALYLLNFYRTYRTMVRAKITALRGQQLAPGYEQEIVLNTSKDYINQALNYLENNHSPKCILLQGVSGSGKSFFANQLNHSLPELGAISINSDRIRKSLYGIESTERINEAEKSSLYSVEMNQKTYAAMLKHAQTALLAGFNVIVDATFLKLAHRKKFYDMARELGAKNYLIHLSITEEEAKTAIKYRQQLNNNPSDADSSIMARQLKTIELPLQTENALILKTSELRLQFPQNQLQEYLDLPLTEIVD